MPLPQSGLPPLELLLEELDELELLLDELELLLDELDELEPPELPVSPSSVPSPSSPDPPESLSDPPGHSGPGSSGPKVPPLVSSSPQAKTRAKRQSQHPSEKHGVRITTPAQYSWRE
jgi:hypothetical protein